MLFLNNAINHGVLTPLGIQEAAEQGKSVLFLLEANPGPGLGLLMAYTFFGRGLAKASAPGAAIIQFFGGIHEIYFPYVLMKPKMILATIAGGMTGIFLLVLFDVGLRAPAAPGSIFAVYAQTPGGDYFGVTVGVFGAALVSFLVGSFLLKMDRSEDGDLMDATAQMEGMKGKKSIASAAFADAEVLGDRPIQNIVFACDAGMGSSAMGASVLRRKIQEAGFGDVTVVNKSISSLTDDYDVVVSHQDLTDRAKQKTGSAIHVSVDNFMGSPRYDEIVELHREHQRSGGRRRSPRRRRPRRASCLPTSPSCSVALPRPATRRSRRRESCSSTSAPSSRRTSPSMHEREESVSTHMGNGLAIPHGTNEAKSSIRRTAISFVRYPERDRLERPPGQVRRRHRRRGQRAPAAARQDRQGLRRQRQGGRARGGPDRRGRPAHPRAGQQRRRRRLIEIEARRAPHHPRGCGVRSCLRAGAAAPADQCGAEHHDQERRAQQQEHHGHGQPGRAGVQHQRGSGAEHLHGDQRRQQGHGDQVRDALDDGSLEDPRRHREPGQLQQVAAHAGRPGSPSTSSVGLRELRRVGPRVSSPASSATRRSREHGYAGRRDRHEAEGDGGGRHRDELVATVAQPGPQQGQERRADRGVEPVGARVADRRRRPRRRRA